MQGRSLWYKVYVWRLKCSPRSLWGARIVVLFRLSKGLFQLIGSLNCPSPFSHGEQGGINTSTPSSRQKIQGRDLDNNSGFFLARMRETPDLQNNDKLATVISCKFYPSYWLSPYNYWARANTNTTHKNSFSIANSILIFRAPKTNGRRHNSTIWLVSNTSNPSSLEKIAKRFPSPARKMIPQHDSPSAQPPWILC